MLSSCDGTYEVLRSDVHKSRFLNSDLQKNVYGSGYFLREPETSRQEMTVSAFRAAQQTWHQWCLLMNVTPA